MGLDESLANGKHVMNLDLKELLLTWAQIKEKQVVDKPSGESHVRTEVMILFGDGYRVEMEGQIGMK